MLFAAFGLLACVGGFAWYFFSPDSEKARSERLADKELQEVIDRIGPQVSNQIAELDRVDAHWRLEDLVAAPPTLKKNPQFWNLIGQAVQDLPEQWCGLISASHPSLPPPQPIPEDLIKDIRAECEHWDKQLESARATAGTYPGKINLNYAPDYYSTVCMHIMHARQVTELLAMDAVMEAEDGRCVKAWQSAFAILNLAPCLSEPPSIITELARINTQRLAVRCFERLLADCHPEDKQLKKAQDHLTMEAKHQLFLSGLRGERAGYYQFFLAVKDGIRDQPGVPNGASQRAYVLRFAPYTLATLNRLIAQAKESTFIKPGQFQSMAMRFPTSFCFASVGSGRTLRWC